MKTLYYILLVPLLVLGMALGACIVGENWLLNNINREKAANQAFMGEGAIYAGKRAERWYNSWFVETKVVQTSLAAVSSEDIPAEMRTTGDEMAQPVLGWLELRVRAWWTFVYQVFVRISIIGMWLPFAVMMLVPFVVDALTVRKIKSTNFGITSPHLHTIGVWGLLAAFVGYALLIFLPFKVHPIWLPLLVIASSGCLWLTIAQFAKRA